MASGLVCLTSLSLVGCKSSGVSNGFFVPAQSEDLGGFLVTSYDAGQSYGQSDGGFLSSIDLTTSSTPQDAASVVGDASTATCGGAFISQCNGNTLSFCLGSKLEMQDCTELGDVCGTDSFGLADCVAPPPDMAGGCGSVTYNGECQGNTVVWCQHNTLQTLDCKTKSSKSKCEVESGFAGCT